MEQDLRTKTWSALICMLSRSGCDKSDSENTVHLDARSALLSANSPTQLPGSTLFLLDHHVI